MISRFPTQPHGRRSQLGCIGKSKKLYVVVLIWSHKKFSAYHPIGAQR